jgi:hypothetical protein
MIIKAQQQITDMENQRIHDQRIVIDIEDKFVTINHNGDELAMNLDCFRNLSNMIRHCDVELRKLPIEDKLLTSVSTMPKIQNFEEVDKKHQHLATYSHEKNQ